MSIHVKVLGGWIEIEGDGSGGGGPSGPVIEGGEVEVIDGWTYHTFRDSDDVNVLVGGEVEAVLVAGGGGGGRSGGGAGGVLPVTLNLTAGVHRVEIGEGGIAVPSNQPTTNGGDTTFFGERAVGGGAGAHHPNPRSGNSGGSGGGSLGVDGQALGTPGQGHDGGNEFRSGDAGGAGSDGIGGPSSGVEIWGEWYGSGGTAGISDMQGSSPTRVPLPGGGGRGSRGAVPADHGVDGTGGGGGGGGPNAAFNAFGVCGRGGKGIMRLRYKAPAGGGEEPGGALAWAALDGGEITSYTDGDGVAWNVHTYNASGDVTVTRAGLVRCLLVGGGSGAQMFFADGGQVQEGLVLAEVGTHPVVVGAGGNDPVGVRGESSSALGMWTGSGFGVVTQGPTTGRGAGYRNPMPLGELWTGRTSTITGTAEDYGRGGRQTIAPRPNRGDGNIGAGATGSAGVVILSVPA